MSYFIPNETTTFDERDPPWLNKKIKKMINYKNAIFNKLLRHNDSSLPLRLCYFQDSIQKLNKPKGSTLKIYLISYQTKTSILKSTGHS